MNTPRDQIFYTDGDPNSSAAVLASLYQTGVDVAHFDTVEECLKAIGDEGCRLLISNVPRPEGEGLDLLARVRRLAPSLPVIVFVDPGEIRTAVRAMKGGATHCLERPPRTDDLRSVLDAVLQQAAPPRKPAPLSEAEQTVLELVLEGQTSRQIAATLQRSQRTVEVHRRHIRDKLGAESAADLMQIAVATGLVQL